MINISFDKKVLAISNSAYTGDDGLVKQSQSIIIFDEDGFLKTPTLRFGKGVFDRLKLSDIKESDKYTNKLCTLSCELSWSGKYGLSLNVTDVKAKTQS